MSQDLMQAAPSQHPPLSPSTPSSPSSLSSSGSDSGPQSPGAGSLTPSPEFLELIPREFARRHLVLSAGCVEEGGEFVERLLVSDTPPRTRPHVAFNVGVRLGRAVRTSPASAEMLAAAIDLAYAGADALARARRTAGDGNAGGGGGADDADGPATLVEGSADLEADLASAVQAAAAAAESDLINVEGKAPGVRLVDLILFEALLRGASDVHVQPLRDRTLVRYRLDGALHTVRELPAGLAASVVSRIKVMGRMDVAERRAPQDGRATVSVGGSGSGAGAHAGRRIDLRISTLPSTFGERVVVRLLDAGRSPHLLSFAALGMPAEVQRRYLAQVGRTSGIVLSTGPTGSGKTTTLYTTLAWISAANTKGHAPSDRPRQRTAGTGRGGAGAGCELNMMTVEDPVEYDLSGLGQSGSVLSVSQTQVDTKKNLTFATGLRHILRQDPDVIMVGEVRDEETARIAVQASLTGHLVLSTLHTNDAAGAIARLLDLGVEPFLVASSLSAVLAQRLVRKMHTACGGEGCGECLGTGFKGRTGVFELLVVDPAIRDMIGRRASAVDIKHAAQHGHAVGGGGGYRMVTLRDEGLRLVRAGVTTAAEVARVIEAIDEVET